MSPFSMFSFNIAAFNITLSSFGARVSLNCICDFFGNLYRLQGSHEGDDSAHKTTNGSHGLNGGASEWYGATTGADGAGA